MEVSTLYYVVVHGDLVDAGLIRVKVARLGSEHQNFEDWRVNKAQLWRYGPSSYSLYCLMKAVLISCGRITYSVVY